MISQELKLTLLVYILVLMYLAVNFRDELAKHSKLIPLVGLGIYYIMYSLHTNST